MATKKTIARGGVIARDLVQRWISRQVKKLDDDDPALFILGDLRDWLKDQKHRTDRPGGIGRQ